MNRSSTRHVTPAHDRTPRHSSQLSEFREFGIGLRLKRSHTVLDNEDFDLYFIRFNPSVNEVQPWIVPPTQDADIADSLAAVLVAQHQHTGAHSVQLATRAACTYTRVADSPIATHSSHIYTRMPRSERDGTISRQAHSPHRALERFTGLHSAPRVSHSMRDEYALLAAPIARASLGVVTQPHPLIAGRPRSAVPFRRPRRRGHRRAGRGGRGRGGWCILDEPYSGMAARLRSSSVAVVAAGARAEGGEEEDYKEPDQAALWHVGERCALQQRLEGAEGGWGARRWRRGRRSGRRGRWRWRRGRRR